MFMDLKRLEMWVMQNQIFLIRRVSEGTMSNFLGIQWLSHAVR